MFTAETRSIVVSVRPAYLEDQSEPEQARWVWAYTVRIENRGGDKVQLLSRHWKITNARGRMEEVKGPGVVGKTPVLQPGQVFEYTSCCPLDTSSGFMTGTYGMASADGEAFEITIPTFSLDSPDSQRTIN